MAYKTVLVHVDESDSAAPRIAVAAALALADGGHLVGAAMTGVARALYYHAQPDIDDVHLQRHVAILRERAQAALAAFAAQARSCGLHSFEPRLLDDEAGAGMSQLARPADVMVVGQHDASLAAPSPLRDFPAHVVMHAACPVLLLPHAPGTVRVGSNILVAWNGSKEASRAVTAALPLLQRAGHVNIAVVDAVDPAEAPAAELAHYLARHGVPCTIQNRHSERHHLRHASEIGAALLALASETGADLLVMGAYGHSRVRETILGGVTRSVMQHMHLPVLMAH